MKLKKIKINNIRSYENQEIVFPEGSTLISGDIGSGKTSVLLCIEFAFFGLQPGQRGSSLLRNGSDSGGVEMEFDVDGKQILIERTLKRNKTISQDYCSITIDGEKKQLSVTELKSLVLDTLNYPKEFSKKQNTLYKFTVYTPQEEMKQIVLQDSETRINVLRHVFGIDKYKRVMENTSIIGVKMREEMRIKEGIISNIEEDRVVLISKEDELENKNHNLFSLEKEFLAKSEERKKAQEEKDEISIIVEGKRNVQQEIEKKRYILSSKNEIISGNKMKIENLKSQVRETEHLEFQEDLIVRIEESIKTMKSEKENLNEEFFEISSKISSLNMKVQESQNLKGKISGLDTCPTCLQKVDDIYKNNIILRADSETNENLQKIKSFSEKKQNLQEKIKNKDIEIQSSEKRLNELIFMRVRLQGINEKKIQIEELEKSNALLGREVETLNYESEELGKKLSDFGKFDIVFEEKKIRFDEAVKNEKIVEIKVAELRKEIQIFSIQIDELKSRLKRAEEIKNQLKHISELENWLSSKFIPLVSFIEKNIMMKLKTEFSNLFSEWFSMLVSDTFNVSLSDDFTPLIEQKDYELDYSYLSGGERTAVALAYRLALNQVINSLMSDIKTKDVIILDEPTDGFSSQQLDKMRDVFNQLNVGQLIIVSHEPKIESYVDNVIKFRKENGVSILE
ncbi:hypothetical protein COU59_00275 [Candidatus Pacearchaeota archaeon CG10_big_fil_rev_8_21_14_0_10_34_12]|nr:MAG: hypothetical protein COU59_00275 [Candidatus Pacearchaeota archaeon CG10_big_fil_rev_8_21_14_0_10_34_12]